MSSSLRLNPFVTRPAKRRGIPVMRGAFPLIGHVPALLGGMLELVRLAEREVGPVFWLDLGFGKSVVCSARRDAWELFKSKSTSSQHTQEVPVDLLGARSLIATDGPDHTRVRGALHSTFSPSGLTGLELGPVFADLITARLATWPERGTLRLLRETRELVLSLMFRMMGVSGGEMSDWRRHYERTMYLGISMPELIGSPKWFGQRSRRWLEARIRLLLADARKKGTAPGLLWALVNARDEQGRPLDEDQLVDNIRLLLLAGHETSGSTMAWATAVCAERDDVWRALCDEALAAKDLPRTPAELKAFPYAEAVFRETLRLYPPVSFDLRRVIAPLELGGIAVPVGTDVAIPIGFLSRDAELYANADHFDPQRWLQKRTPVTAAELVQFGAGPHFCLGYHVAWLELVQYLVALARTLGAKGLRARLTAPFPASRYLPILHPASDPRIRIA